MSNVTHSLEVRDAMQYGVGEAIFLNHLKYWLIKNKSDGKNQFDGRTWTYNSKRTYTKIFPYWTEKQIRRIIDSLIKNKVIIKGNYNKSPYDKTSWYALNDESCLGPLYSLEQPKWSALSSEEVQAIPIDIHSINNNKRVAKAPRLNFSESHMNIAKTMQRKIKDINPNFAAKDIEAWANEIRLMTDRDKRHETEIVDLFNWANDHSFWRANILSPKKLRKQWDTLMTQKLAEKDKGKNEDEDWIYNWQSGNAV